MGAGFVACGVVTALLRLAVTNKMIGAQEIEMSLETDTVTVAVCTDEQTVRARYPYGSSRQHPRRSGWSAHGAYIKCADFRGPQHS